MLKCYFNQNGICQRLNLQTFDECRCPLYRSYAPETCAICGKPILGHTIWFNNSGLCEDCGKLIGACPTCTERSHCAFETDPSPVPKAVQQTVRNGNMFSSFSVRNPARVAKTCVDQKCECYTAENGCRRDLGGCPNWAWTKSQDQGAARSDEPIDPAE